MRESLAVMPQPTWRMGLIAGLQASATALLALPLVAVSPWPHLIGFASLGTLVALFGRFAPPAARSGIVLRCLFWQVFAVVALSTAAWLGAPAWLQLLLLALGCGLFFYVSTAGRFGPPGALIFVFAASASVGQTVSLAQLLERAAAVFLAGVLAWIVCLATEPWRRRADAGFGLPPEPARPTRQLWFMAGRIALGSAVAAFAAHAGGAAFPGWAAMGAVAVMQGAHLHISMNRALQRMAGTIVGAGLVWLVLVQDPPAWAVIAIILCLMVATEVVIGSNYGIGQVLVTPMALLMTYLAAPHAAGLGMVPERVLDTLVGAGIGIVLAVLLSSIEDRLHLARHHAARMKR